MNKSNQGILLQNESSGKNCLISIGVRDEMAIVSLKLDIKMVTSLTENKIFSRFYNACYHSAIFPF